MKDYATYLLQTASYLVEVSFPAVFIIAAGNQFRYLVPVYFAAIACRGYHHDQTC